MKEIRTKIVRALVTSREHQKFKLWCYKNSTLMSDVVRERVKEILRTRNEKVKDPHNKK